MVQIDFIKKEYPLHLLVWQNDYHQLEKELSSREVIKIYR